MSTEVSKDIEEQLIKDGWSKQLILQMKKDGQVFLDVRVGSPMFMSLWHQTLQLTSDKKACLEIFLNHIGLTEDDIKIDSASVKTSLEKFSPVLRPDHDFWKSLAQTVSTAFPENELRQKTPLGRQIHQLRYLISGQQAQWIRDHIKTDKMTDQEALAVFLKDKKEQSWFPLGYDYSLNESARLHNKYYLKNGKKIYPDQEITTNFKVLVHFHTEFIIDKKGHFVNLIDYERQTENGIINTASFNYATSNNKRHKELDINPVSIHDPKSRKKFFPRFKAALNLQKEWFFFEPKDWNKSYFHDDNAYKHVVRQVDHFRKIIKRES
ncbi:DUF3114 domain-containing protein [Streptococcus sp. CSL10205-OR2]|uniref:DUF3114 domain-containing protein n=1 Tax=Streptococcus sp. CSL10205-OR2 TaxID=2980558 RepID=UPI0021D8A896|nr:DUF3114 domain-containing protein [Streptococcus sp. CSL10205-OR2]MCU9532936.1 DUF3114 domain-containing protein [Streptococcus sp. CSL10205-OR2]